tara:strand:+ start:239 stop:1687 length:1449 start_codon:yes stop_codon:yes gene_type:complete
MATRNTPTTSTLEEWRVEFNELATDIGNVTGSTQGDQLTTSATDIVGAINELETNFNAFADDTTTAADNITTGNAAVSITTSSGNITIDAAANNTDIIFKGTDATADITMLTLDGSEAGAATFNSTVTATGYTIGSASVLVANHNMIINGDMTVAQRGITITDAAVNNVSTTTNADDSYTLDRWILVSDGDNIVDVTQEDDGPDGGGTKSIRLDVETIDKQFGIVQWIEHVNCHEAIGETVSLSFKMKVTGAKMDDVRAAVVAWSGTKDAPTSDIVATWQSEGTVPTLATTCTYENTAANLSPTTSWATYTIENVSVDTSSTANIGVFIWSGVDDTDAANFLYITDVQLETSATANAFKRLDLSTTMKQCERYYETSMSWGEDSQHEGQKVVYGLGSATYAAEVDSIGGIQYRTRKRTSPTTVIYDQDGLAGSVYRIHDGVRVSGTVAAQHTMDYGFTFATKTDAFGHGFSYYYGYTAEAEL